MANLFEPSDANGLVWIMDYDFTHVYSSYLRENAITNEEKDSVREKSSDARKRFWENSSEIGFTSLPFEFSNIDSEFEKIDRLKEGKENLVVIGIGGSDLGTRTIISALKSRYENEDEKKDGSLKVYFSGDTTDPMVLKQLLEALDLAKTLFYVVSKSGDTVETASVFYLFLKETEKIVGKERLVDHFVFCTSENSGTLKKLAEKHGFIINPVPENVGGRYSVLSTVGLIPAKFAGIDVSEILDGAARMHDELQNYSDDEDPALEFAKINYIYATKKNKNILALIPYEYNLGEFGLWFKQLWAESLGKENLGSTPVTTVGPTYQHSQLQLFNEGPNDKLLNFIIAEKSDYDFSLPEDYEGYEEYRYLKGKTFHGLLNDEFKTTRYSLTKNGRPNIVFTIPEVSGFALGQLFYFYEVATVYAGYIYGVDPFNQPGVELSKNTMFSILGKEGYEIDPDYEAFNS